ncbi:MAG: class I SAM-dependent methyltransferase [Candidatus Pacebacteria bacterium]|nr:class I SAM-dependent methyltransferase [Candidatus Paceibacterota bacterium]
MNSSDSAHKRKVASFYDHISPLWLKLWGIHLHHGYWKTGLESKELAQEQLTSDLAKRAGIRSGTTILDVGCGMGGSSIWLAQEYGAKTVGISLSPSQVELATKTAKNKGVDSTFIVMDAESAEFSTCFDVVWSIEAVSHLSHPENFFRLASRCLKTGGRIALIDWFHSNDLTRKQEEAYITTIKNAMLVPAMTSMSRYSEFAERNGFKVIETEDISENVARSWDIGFEIISKPEIWKMAMKEGSTVLKFIRDIRLMRKGFSSKTFRYGVLIAQKI